MTSLPSGEDKGATGGCPPKYPSNMSDPDPKHDSNKFALPPNCFFCIDNDNDDDDDDDDALAA